MTDDKGFPAKEYIILGPIDDQTDDICSAMIGKEFVNLRETISGVSVVPPHITDCRCYIKPTGETRYQKRIVQN